MLFGNMVPFMGVRVEALILILLLDIHICMREDTH